MIATKRARLDEIVGQLKEEKEEELEGEVLGDSDTGSLLYSSLLPINLLIQFILVFVYIVFSFFSVPLQMIQKKRWEKEGPILKKKRT